RGPGAASRTWSLQPLTGSGGLITTASWSRSAIFHRSSMRRHIGARGQTSHYWRHSSNQVSDEHDAVQTVGGEHVMPHAILCGIVSIGLVLRACARDAPNRSAGESTHAGVEYSVSPVFTIGADDGPEDQIIGRVHSAFVRGPSVFVANGIEPE